MKLFSSRSTPKMQIASPPGTGRGVRGWFATLQKPILNKRLATKVTIVFAAISIGRTVTTVGISDNSGPRPYFVEYGRQSGTACCSEKCAEAFTPATGNSAYFLHKWTTRAFTINLDAQGTLKRQIPLARMRISDAATKKLDTCITGTDPAIRRVVNTPGLTYQFEDNPISFSADGNIAYMIVTLTENIAGVRQTPKQKLLIINFLTAPQQLKPEDRKNNPIGMRITDLSITPYTGITPGSTK